MKLKLALLGLVAALVGVYFWYPKAKPVVVSSCPQEKVISIDLEKSTYSPTNVLTVAGKIEGSFSLKELQYDLVMYDGGPDAIGELGVMQAGKFEPATDRHSGWQVVNTVSQSPSQFTISPVFPPKFLEAEFIGIYFRVTCEDGTYTPDHKLTRMVIDRHLSGHRLYGVSANSPIGSKYFK